MNSLSYRTISANSATADKKWLLVDADGQPLGRLASKVASLIRGKHKTNFTPHADCGDNVVVINASRVKLTGKKWDQKTYVSYTGYPGGQRFTPVKDQLRKKPVSLVEIAVKGMLPKNRLGRALFNNLRVFEGENHNLEAQKPIKIALKN